MPVFNFVVPEGPCKQISFDSVNLLIILYSVDCGIFEVFAISFIEETFQIGEHLAIIVSE